MQAGMEILASKALQKQAEKSLNGCFRWLMVEKVSSFSKKRWYIPSAWSDGAMVSGYSTVDFSNADIGEYTVGKDSTDSKKYYAYNVSTYTLYTVRDTGIADVYLDGSQTGGAITVLV